MRRYVNIKRNFNILMSKLKKSTSEASCAPFVKNYVNRARGAKEKIIGK